MKQQMRHSDYKQLMLDRFADYRRRRFFDQVELFDPQRDHVFSAEHAEENLFNSALDYWVPHDRRHTWLASVGSSQGLTVSVFGLMLDRSDLSLLYEVPDEQGLPLLPRFVLAGKPEFDYKVKSLHKPRPTQVDLFLPGQSGNIAIECKLWEDRLSPCSQVPEHCDHTYRYRADRGPGEGCIPTQKGIRYWEYIPQLFTWRADQGYPTCPIWRPYQLVRNVLAAAVDSVTEKVWGQPVTVLVYVANNPACGAVGPIDEQYRAVERALRDPATLRRTTWQAIAGVLAAKGRYEDLLVWLEAKYGLMP